MSFLSHPDTLLADHIEQICRLYGNDLYFTTLATYHDVGKMCRFFQDYIRDPRNYKGPREGHAEISALLYFIMHLDGEKLETQKELIFGYIAILRHHLPLPSYRSLMKNWQLYGIPQEILKQKAELESYEESTKILGKKIPGLPNVKTLALTNRKICFSIHDYVQQKQIFSRLIFADKCAAIFKGSYRTAQFDFDPAISEEEIEKRNEGNPSPDRMEARKTILENYRSNPDASIYQITAPTGIGKTLLSLDLALQIAKTRNHKRIIYAIPFTSIIDQSYAIFDSLFEGKIAKHHHKADFSKTGNEEIDNDYNRLKYLTESWHHPFIVTTFYQFCFALFSAQNSENVRFQAMENSVIVLDEAQALPFELWKPLQEIFPVLAEQLGCTFILMSATMPVIVKTNEVAEISPKEILYQQKKRYQMMNLAVSEDEDKLEILAGRIVDFSLSGNSVLCVLNSVSDSKVLYRKLKSKVSDTPLYCLNAYMLQSDREKVLESLRQDPDSNRVENKILISTQVIEAGVDLDFDVGFREMAPLSSLIQTAGRINREGLQKISTLWVFEGKSKIYDSTIMDITRQVLKNAWNEHDGRLKEENLLLYCEDYFIRTNESVDRSKILESIAEFDFPAIDKELNELFKKEGELKASVVIGIDLMEIERKYWEESEKIEDPWEKKACLEQTIKNLQPRMLNIWQWDLDYISSKGIDIPLCKTFGLYSLPNYGDIYFPASGFLVKAEEDYIGVFGEFVLDAIHSFKPNPLQDDSIDALNNFD